MDSLRTHPLIARLVLAWFVLFVGVSVASPIVSPSASQLICSASGAMKLVSLDGGDDSGGSSGLASLDCPACSPMAVALPLAEPVVVVASALSHALRPVAAARLAWLTRAALPARGPPLYS